MEVVLTGPSATATLTLTNNDTNTLSTLGGDQRKR